MQQTDTIQDTDQNRLDEIVERAGAVSKTFASALPSERAAWIGAVADALDAAAGRLVPIAQRESNLPLQRLTGELARTTYQLRTFVTLLNDGDYLEVVIDHANADHPVGPAPDLRRMLQPLGPVAVYSASNFPFAFSVAGGDTASALAAGCPVIVKAHPGHPELSAAMAEIVTDALAAAGAPDGVFAVVYGYEAGTALLRHPLIEAGAFTGSTGGGRALFDIANSRERPIPFYGELGSVNPAFVTREAASERGEAIASGFAGSYTLGVGQFCTKPGVLFVPRGSGLVEAVTEAARPAPAGRMLNSSISDRLARLEEEIAADPDVEVLLAGGAVADGEGGEAWSPSLYRASADVVRARPELVLEERFGPSAVVVEYDEASELPQLAELFEGTLTATVQGRDASDDGVAELIDVLAERAGRVLWNGWPTGVTVSAAMQHGGPYPSATSSLYTSVGTSAIRRFLRPVCYQAIPDALLPPALQEANPLGIPRTVDGRREPGSHVE